MMSVWSPTHVQFTVLRARNLIAKGKGGNNDVFVTIQLGKEKYQTSTIKNASCPEWFEECDLPIPHMHTEVEVSVFHRGVLSDDFLGYAAVPLWEHKVSDTPRSEWVSLQSKPGSKSADPNKYRGQLEVKLTFHCQSRGDVIGPSHGLKKKSSSIRNIAAVFGDKFRRSRSFRENRRDPEGGKPEKGRSAFIRDSTSTLDRQMNTETPPPRPPGRPPFGPPQHPQHPYRVPLQPSVHFSALDVNRAPWGDDPNAPDGLTRSYSLSAAYIKSMSLDRGNRPGNFTNDNGMPGRNANTINNSRVFNNGNNNGSAVFIAGDAGVNQLHSQSMYNLPGNRRSCAEVPFHQPPPPPYDPHHASKDDSALIMPRDRRAVSEYHINNTSNSAFRPTPTSSHHPPPLINAGSAYFVDQGGSRRDRGGGIYESIKERTEPENSASSSSDLESVPGPRPRAAKRFARRDVPVMGSSGRDYCKEIYSLPNNRNGSNGNTVTNDQAVFSARDSGILEDRSSSHGNSLEGSINAATDSTLSTAFSQSRGSQASGNDPSGSGSTILGHVGQSYNDQKGEKLMMNSGPQAFLYHLERDSVLTSSGRAMGTKKKVPVPSQFYSKETSQGELVVRKRSRGERDRLRQLRQGNRRYTVQGLDHHTGSLYEESLSEPSDSSKPEVPEDIISIFRNMTQEELLRVVIQTKAQMIRKDQYIKDLENYIDDLLVRVMETTPKLLSQGRLQKL